jgi:hypothetical protein
MNERLQELLEQASEVHDYWYRGDSQRLVDHKMFAELIIQECIQAIQNESMNSKDEWEDGLRIAEGAIREHFGVK